MTGMNRGPGGGPKRRLRTQRRSIDGRTCLILRNRSKKPMPANWRELLIAMVVETCEKPSKRVLSRLVDTGSIPSPATHVAADSLPTGMVEFTLDKRAGIARLQLQVIEYSLSFLDVKYWPVPKPTARIGARQECFVNTGLSLNDNLFGINRHQFSAFRLKDIPGIDWTHLRRYTAMRGKGEYVGVKTACGEPCSCRHSLPDLWPLGWEMHY